MLMLLRVFVDAVPTRGIVNRLPKNQTPNPIDALHGDRKSRSLHHPESDERIGRVGKTSYLYISSYQFDVLGRLEATVLGINQALVAYWRLSVG